MNATFNLKRFFLLGIIRSKKPENTCYGAQYCSGNLPSLYDVRHK